MNLCSLSRVIFRYEWTKKLTLQVIYFYSDANAESTSGGVYSETSLTFLLYMLDNGQIPFFIEHQRLFPELETDSVFRACFDCICFELFRFTHIISSGITRRTQNKYTQFKNNMTQRTCSNKKCCELQDFWRKRQKE